MAKIVCAVGGTGGHLFPAQALAKELKEEGHELLFAGGKLGANPFFQKGPFPFEEIPGASPFRSNALKAGAKLLVGIGKSLSLLRRTTPDLVIGFGSFYSFPVLAAARLRKIPYILVETNAHPGKVNRLFAKGALFTALQYEEGGELLEGNTRLAQIPARTKKSPLSSHEEAKKYYGLDPTRFTLLIFGGSGGAAIFEQVADLIDPEVQVLHFCGKGANSKHLEKKYADRGVFARVKPFEDRMEIAMQAADLALCRSGSGTLNDLALHSTPSILVPWPGATENHQHKNARILENSGGAIVLEQSQVATLPAEVARAKEKLEQMRESLKKRQEPPAPDLKELIVEQLELCKNTFI